jgi:hypothetical protein
LPQQRGLPVVAAQLIQEPLLTVERLAAAIVTDPPAPPPNDQAARADDAADRLAEELPTRLVGVARELVQKSLQVLSHLATHGLRR